MLTQRTKLIVKIAAVVAGIVVMVYSEVATRHSLEESRRVLATAIQDLTVALGKDSQRPPVGVPVKSANSTDPVQIVLAADFPQFTGTLDRMLHERGDFLDGCSKRLLWIGETSIQDAGESLVLSSKVRYEQWICSWLGDARLFWDTRVVQWRISVNSAPLDELRLVAEVANVKGLNNTLEDIFGLRFRKEIDIPFPADCGNCECSQVADLINATLESTRFLQTGDGAVRVEATFSISGDLTNLLKCRQ